jgi:ERCC4-type nuclease
MVHLSILRDNREQKGWDFEEQDASISDETLTTGDYTLAELCQHDDKQDTYYPTFAIERKAGEDFVKSITHGRDRFLEEIKRASDWDVPLPVLIEEPRTTFKRKRGFMKYRDVAPSQIFGTTNKWEKYYNVNFIFAGTRERAQRKAFEKLGTRLRASLVGGD